MADLPLDKEHEITLDVRVKLEQALPKKIGESMRKSGYEPHLPILIIPGMDIRATRGDGKTVFRITNCLI